jgi:cyanophycinase
MRMGRAAVRVLLFAFAFAPGGVGGCANGVSTSAPLEGLPPPDQSVQSPDLKPEVVFYPRVGNLDDDMWGTTGPGVVLMNDATGPTSAYKWMHATVDLTRIAGDVLVLCTSCGDIYSWNLYQLAPFNSVQTVLVPPHAKASDVQLVADRLGTVEIVILSDGDLPTYAAWGGTPLAAAVQDVFVRGGVVAGAGTGASALGWAVLTTPVDSATALANPYASGITLARGPFGLPAMAGAYVELGLETSDRFGVLAAMTARSISDGLADTKPSAAFGVGLDANAALAIDRAGNVTLLTDEGAPGDAWLLQGAAAQQIAAGLALVWSDAEVARFDAPGESLRLGGGCGTAFSYSVGIDGADGAPFTPANPYEAAGIASPCGD